LKSGGSGLTILLTGGLFHFVLFPVYSVLGFNTTPSLPYRVMQAAKRQAKQLNAVLWRGGSLNVIFLKIIS
jgi:hypothetical protein